MTKRKHPKKPFVLRPKVKREGDEPDEEEAAEEETEDTEETTDDEELASDTEGGEAEEVPEEEPVAEEEDSYPPGQAPVKKRTKKEDKEELENLELICQNPKLTVREFRKLTGTGDEAINVLDELELAGFVTRLWENNKGVHVLTPEGEARRVALGGLPYVPDEPQTKPAPKAKPTVDPDDFE